MHGARGFDRNAHSRMPLSFTPFLNLKRCHACAQWYSSRLPITSYRYHRKLRPNTEGPDDADADDSPFGLFQISQDVGECAAMQAAAAAHSGCDNEVYTTEETCVAADFVWKDVVYSYYNKSSSLYRVESYLDTDDVRCAFSNRILHSRVPLNPTHVGLKRTCV